MTISNNDPRVQIVADGTTGPYPFNFRIFSEEDIRVFDGESQKALTTHYTVDFDFEDADAEEGAINFVSGQQPTSGSTITIDRDIPTERTVDLQQSGPPVQKELNEDIDRIWAKLQEFEEGFKRLVRLADTTAFVGDVIYPDGGVSEAGKVVGWANDGLSLENKELVDLGQVSLPLTVANGGTGAADAAAARANLDVPGLNVQSEFNANVVMKGFLIHQVISDDPTDQAAVFYDLRTNSPDVNDVMPSIRFRAENSAGELTEYFRVRARIDDPTDGSEDGRMEFVSRIDGALNTRWVMREGFYSLGAVGFDRGGGTINITDDYMRNAKSVTRYNSIVNKALPAAASDVVVGIDISDYADIIIVVDDMSASADSEFRLSFGDSTDYTTGVISKGATRDENNANTQWSSGIGIPIIVGSGFGDINSGGFHMRRMPTVIAEAMFGSGWAAWYVNGVINSTNNLGNLGWGGGIYATNKTVDRARLLTTAGVFDGGRWAAMGR